MTTVTCCDPLLGSVVDDADAEHLATRFKALADPTRVKLLSMIASRDEVCGCELVEPMGLSQPTLSHHLKVLADGGLLQRERRGRWIIYRADTDAIADLHGALRV